MSEHHHPEPESYASIRTKALESLLVEKGIVTTDAIDALVEAYEQDIGPRNGAHVVAHAWVDPEYRKRLLEDGTSAISELGYVSGQGAEFVVVENTPDVHNMIVCTLCSCYPAGLLGLPPKWYKDFAYRSRAVIEPRAVLDEFGLRLPESVEVRVWDSTAELRYMVLPERPPGTEGMDEEQLAELVSRDAMIGVAEVSLEGAGVMTNRADPEVANMEGIEALPRKNGELVFDELWEGRVFGMAVALNDQGLYPWREFRDALASRIAAADSVAEASTYYERFLAAFEKLALARGFVTPEELDRRTAEYESGERDDFEDDHHHEHGHSH